MANVHAHKVLSVTLAILVAACCSEIVGDSDNIAYENDLQFLVQKVVSLDNELKQQAILNQQQQTRIEQLEILPKTGNTLDENSKEPQTTFVQLNRSMTPREASNRLRQGVLSK